jgi:hypothetical protein
MHRDTSLIRNSYAQGYLAHKKHRLWKSRRPTGCTPRCCRGERLVYHVASLSDPLIVYQFAFLSDPLITGSSPLNEGSYGQNLERLVHQSANTATSRQRGKSNDTYGHQPVTTPKDGSCKYTSRPPRRNTGEGNNRLWTRTGTHRL